MAVHSEDMACGCRIRLLLAGVWSCMIFPSQVYKMHIQMARSMLSVCVVVFGGVVLSGAVRRVVERAVGSGAQHRRVMPCCGERQQQICRHVAGKVIVRYPCGCLIPVISSLLYSCTCADAMVWLRGYLELPTCHERTPTLNIFDPSAMLLYRGICTVYSTCVYFFWNVYSG